MAVAAEVDHSSHAREWSARLLAQSTVRSLLFKTSLEKNVQALQALVFGVYRDYENIICFVQSWHSKARIKSEAVK